MPAFVTQPTVTVIGSYPQPEGVAAGCARISRSAEPISKLVQDAIGDTQMARARNERTVFGFGHASVAEHACFSVAIEDIPRSLSLDVVLHRLASYTELSYRYVAPTPDQIRFYLPQEYQEPRYHAIMHAATDHARAAYGDLMRLLVAQEMSQDKPPSEQTAQRRATEDARYVLPICQVTNLGMTANARTWGYVIATLRAGAHSEHRQLGDALFAALHPLAPSLFPEKYLGPACYEQSALDAVREARGLYTSWSHDLEYGLPTQDGVTLVHHDPLAERFLAEALLVRTSTVDALERATAMASAAPDDRAAILQSAATGLDAHDRVLRECEIVHYTYEIVCSEACLHQLVRHRMATHLPQPRSLGTTTVPPRIAQHPEAAHLYQQTLHICAEGYAALGTTSRADLLLCSGHNRRTLLHLNARELIEMTRLRLEPTAQWEIREKVGAMADLVRAAHPHISAFLGGRKAFKKDVSTV